jgi:type IV pilus assembly protein PilC
MLGAKKASVSARDSGLPIHRYRWKGISRQGNRIQGECMGTSEIAARTNLLREGVNVTNIRRIDSPWWQRASSRSTTLKTMETTLFLRKLATLFASGIPPLQAFELLQGPGASQAARELSRDLGRRLQEGATLAGALGSRPDIFERVTRELIAAGERGGTLDTMLARVVHHQEAREQLRERLRKALFYPSMVFGFGLLVTLVLILWVIPRFESVFSGLGGELPALTQMVFATSQTIRANSFWALSALGLALLLRVFGSPQRLRIIGFAALHHLPVVGPALLHGILAQTCRTLGTLYGAGVPVTEALEQTADTIDESRLRLALRVAATEMRGGSSLHRALRATGRFPETLVGMIQIGEESGRLEVMLERAADLHQTDLDRNLERLMSLIEPITMAILGTVVGGLVLAMYLPVFMLGQSL